MSITHYTFGVDKFVHVNKCYIFFQYPGKFCDNDSIFAATLKQLGDAPHNTLPGILEETYASIWQMQETTFM